MGREAGEGGRNFPRTTPGIGLKDRPLPSRANTVAAWRGVRESVTMSATEQRTEAWVAPTTKKGGRGTGEDSVLARRSQG